MTPRLRSPDEAAALALWPRALVPTPPGRPPTWRSEGLGPRLGVFVGVSQTVCWFVWLVCLFQIKCRNSSVSGNFLLIWCCPLAIFFFLQTFQRFQILVLLELLRCWLLKVLHGHLCCSCMVMLVVPLPGICTAR